MTEPMPLVLDTDRDRRRELRELGLHLTETLALLVGPLLLFVFFLIVVNYIDFTHWNPAIGDEPWIPEATRRVP